MVITKKCFSRMENEESKQFLEMVGYWTSVGSPPGAAGQKRRIYPPGRISQFHPPGITSIMTCRVYMIMYVYIYIYVICICMLYIHIIHIYIYIYYTYTLSLS